VGVRGDGGCDLGCNNAICGYDSTGGTGTSLRDGDCYETCLYSGCEMETYLGNTDCDEDDSCNTVQCGWEQGECGYCASGCLLGIVGESDHNTALGKACSFDGGDCGGWCSLNCSKAFHENGSCDAVCNNYTCDADNWDCTPLNSDNCAPGCTVDMADDDDDRCDTECYVSACEFDGNDCDCSTGCTDILLANSICDTGICDTEQ
jgi:hypothetical protein